MGWPMFGAIVTHLCSGVTGQRYGFLACPWLAALRAA